MKTLNLYKLAILMGFLFSVNSLSSAIVASLLNVEWRDLSASTKFLLIVVVLQNWTGTLLAFFNKSVHRIEQGKFPFETGDTGQWKKQPEEQKQVTTKQDIKIQ